MNDLVASYDFLGLLDALKGKNEETIEQQAPVCLYDRKVRMCLSRCLDSPPPSSTRGPLIGPGPEVPPQSGLVD